MFHSLVVKKISLDSHIVVVYSIGNAIDVGVDRIRGEQNPAWPGHFKPGPGSSSCRPNLGYTHYLFFLLLLYIFIFFL